MKVGILGFGNVAAATIEGFTANQDLIQAKTATVIKFVQVATRTPSRAQGRVPEGCMVSGDCWAVVDDPEIDVVIELMGDVKLGRELVLRALANKKHVVTANKALLALHGDEILQMADLVGRRVLFEGAVAVSIPIVKTLRESAAANRVTSIVGILNGTSNYVLSQMSNHGVDFATALADARRKGFAEADPTLDINGEDAAHKLTLLASLAFGIPIDFSAVEYRGITEIDQVDIEFSKRLGHQVKLIAQAKLEPSGVFVRVEPTLVRDISMLAQISGSMNGIALQGDLLGSAFLYGSGAGGRQTASAILADLLELANRGDLSEASGTHNMGFRRSGSERADIRYCREQTGAFYIRLRLDDKAGALARVTSILADANVSIASMLQDHSLDAVSDVILITHDVGSNQIGRMLPDLQRTASPNRTVVVYPVLADCGC